MRVAVLAELGQFRDEPCPASPVLIECPVCAGKGRGAWRVARGACEEKQDENADASDSSRTTDHGPRATTCSACSGKGEFLVDEPVGQYVGPEVAEVMQLAELWRRGLPPIAGGALDQAAAFVAAVSFIDAERAYWIGKLRKQRGA